MPASALTPTTASPASAGMSETALRRIDDHLKRRYLDAGRFAGTQILVYRRGAIVHSEVAGLCRSRTQGAGQARHPVPDLFDDQAADLGGVHDAGRGRPRRAGRAGGEIHSAMEGPRRLPGRHRRAVSDQAAGATDADRRPAAPHLGPDLRLPEPHQCRRRLSRQEGRRGRKVRHHAVDDRRSGHHPAGVLARRGLELLGLHRRGGLSGRDHQRPAVRAIPAAADSRSARHEGHRISTCRRKRRTGSPPATPPTARAA